VRDNGPLLVYDENDNLTILDWAFNGWGSDTPYSLCYVIPASISSDTGIPRIDLSAMTLEGGFIEHDGEGIMIATRSSVTHSSRNPNLTETETEIETYLTTYLGLTNFICLDGVYGQDITDHHIDGFVKFANDSTIITMDSTSLDYWLVTGAEINTIYNAANTEGEPYNIVYVPLTQNNVTIACGNNLPNKGSYCNYHIGNDAVIVPIYNDPNDSVALAIFKDVSLIEML
jgi:agmatine deiminase